MTQEQCVTARGSDRRLRVVGACEIRAVMGFADLLEPVAEAFVSTSRGAAHNGLLTLYPAATPGHGNVYVKTGVVDGFDTFVVKVSPWFAVNTERGDPQGGFIAVLDSASGHTRAILEDEHFLSDIRTAAAGAIAARLLAKDDVECATVLGAGEQAYWQSVALHHVRPFERLRLWARRAEMAAALAKRLLDALPGVAIAVVDDAEAAVRAADVIVTTTSARDPILRADWLRPGQHISAIGADDASKCELEPAVLRRARVFVDDRETSLRTGEVHRAVTMGEYDPQMIAGDIGEVLTGKVQGRAGPEDITVATFSGLGAQDLAAARVAVRLLEL